MQQERQGRRGGIWCGILVVLCVLVSGVPTVQADNRFTDRSLLGVWGFSADGVLDTVGPAVAAGIFTFDGEGGCTFSETLNISGVGVVARTADTCTYSVNEDGTGTVERTFGDDSSPVAFVILLRREEMHFIVTEPGVVARGMAKRQR